MENEICFDEPLNDYINWEGDMDQFVEFLNFSQEPAIQKLIQWQFPYSCVVILEANMLDLYKYIFDLKIQQ